MRHWYHTILFLFFLIPIRTTAQKIAIKTNLLMDGAMAPNLGLEVVTGERTSLELDLGETKNPWWATEGKALFIQPEYRYWFNGRPMTRQYVGLGLIGAHYDLTFGSEHHHGNAVGAGLTVGYDVMLGKRLVLDCFGSVGAIYYKQRQFYATDHGADNVDDWYADGGSHNNATGYLLSPVKIGIAISYILK